MMEVGKHPMKFVETWKLKLKFDSWNASLVKKKDAVTCAPISACCLRLPRVQNVDGSLLDA